MNLDKVWISPDKCYDHCVEMEPGRGFPDIWTDNVWVYIAYEIGEIEMYPMHRIELATPRDDLKYPGDK